MGSAEPSVGAANTSAAGPSRDQLHATQRPSRETCGPCSTGTESRASSRLSGFTNEAYDLFLDRPGTVGSAPADRIGPGDETLKPESTSEGWRGVNVDRLDGLVCGPPSVLGG